MYVDLKRYHYTFLLTAIMNKIVLGQILDLLGICFMAQNVNYWVASNCVTTIIKQP